MDFQANFFTIELCPSLQEAERNNMCEVGNREDNRETKTKTPLSRMQGRTNKQSWADKLHSITFTKELCFCSYNNVDSALFNFQRGQKW